jgi:cytochrome c biogenesis protein
MTETASIAPPAAGPGKSFTSSLVGFLASVRLAVILLILLALVSIIGTILFQGDSSQENIQLFTTMVWNLYHRLGFVDAGSQESVMRYQALARDQGVGLYNFSHRIGLDRLYSTWYFNLLLFLLCLNLVVCTLKHWPHTWHYFKKPLLILEGEGAAGIPLRREFTLKRPPGDVATAAAVVLAARGYRTVTTPGGDSSAHLFGQRGLWGRLGLYVVHASILFILVGAVIGFQYGWKGFMPIEEGDAENVVRLRGDAGKKTLPFALRCDDFQVTYYDGENMRPKDYKSKLTVLAGNTPLFSKTIEVNDPLIHQGIYFYQSSYGETGKGGMIRVRLTSQDGLKSRDYTLPLDQVTQMPEFGLTAEIMRFVPDFDMEGSKVVTRSNQAKNPAAAIRLTLADGRALSTWLLQRMPEFNSLTNVDFRMVMTGYEGHQYTGLQVAYDPGVPVVWLGCGLMIIGVFWAFFVPHRRVWVKAVPSGKGTVVYVAGSTSKNRAAFEDEFAALADAVKEGCQA